MGLRMGGSDSPGSASFIAYVRLGPSAMSTPSTITEPFTYPSTTVEDRIQIDILPVLQIMKFSISKPSTAVVRRQLALRSQPCLYSAQMALNMKSIYSRLHIIGS